MPRISARECRGTSLSNPAKRTLTRTKKGHARLTPRRYLKVRAQVTARVEARLARVLPPEDGRI